MFLEDILKKSAIAIKPTGNLKVSESAEAYRELNNPGSYVGKWRNSFAPYLTEIMDEFGSLTQDAVIFAGPARCGKSDIFFNYLTHIQINDPSDFMLVHMTKTTARDWSIGDLRKVFRTTPALGNLVMPGRQNMNVHDVHFIGDTRLLIKWPTLAELSGKTVPRQWLMDYDRMPEDVEKEGPPFHLTKKRGDTFSVSYRMTVAESSPGHMVEQSEDGAIWEAETDHEAPPTKGILSLYNGGDRRLWYWRCACCDHPFEGDFKHLVWDVWITDPFEASQTVRMKCPNPECGFEHTHDADLANGQPGKAGLNLAGKWIKDGQYWDHDGVVRGEAVKSTTASFWLKGTAAAFQTWQNLLYKYLSAKLVLKRTGSDADLKTTTNVDQGHPYDPEARGDSLRPEDIRRRPKTFTRGEVPDLVRFMIATIDVQKTSFEVMITGFDDSDNAYIIDRYSIKFSKRIDEEYDNQRKPIDPAGQPLDWDILIEEVFMKTYPLADNSGRVMGIYMAASDSAGRDGFTVNAYQFWRRLRDDPEKRGFHEMFLLLKGASSPDAARFRVTYPDGDRKDRKARARGEIPVGMIGTLVMKDKAYGMLSNEEEGSSGRVLFGEGFGKWVYNEMLSEVRIKNPPKWDNPKKVRNESFDLLTYAISLRLHRRIRYEKINWDDPDRVPGWAAEWDENDLVFEVNEEGIAVMKEDEAEEDRSLSQLGSLLA